MTTLAKQAENARHRAEIAGAKVRAAQAAALLDRMESVQRMRLPRASASVGSHDRTKSHRLRARGPGRAPSASVDAYLTQERLDLMRRDGRDALDNAPLARALIDRCIDVVVGPGFALQVDSADEAFNDEAESLWNEWAAGPGDNSAPDAVRCDIRGVMSLGELCRAAVRQVLVDGDVLLVPTEFGAVQFIDAALVVGPARRTYAATQDGRQVVNGVEVDDYGAPVAFHVARYNHLGSGVTQPVRRIPVVEGAFLLSRPEWFTQTRGEPRLAGVVEDLLRLDEFIVDTAQAAHIATLLAFYTKTNDPDLAKYALAQSNPQPDSRSDVATTPNEGVAEPGSTIHLAPNEDMGMLKSEQPGPQFQPFVYALARMLGSYMGLPLELVLMDFSQTNFHSGKSALIVAERGINGWQRWLIGALLKRLYRWRIAQWIAQGKLREVEGWDRATFTPPPRLVLDPENEAKTNGLLVAQGMKTLKECAAERGLDWQDIAEQRAVEIRLFKKLGIPLPAMPGAAPMEGSPNGNTGESQTDENGEPIEASEGMEPATEGEGVQGNKSGVVKPKVPTGLNAGKGATAFLIGDKTLAHAMAVDIVEKQIPAESAHAILTDMIGLSDESADRIIGPTATFKPPERPAPEVVEAPAAA